jgi:CheY-like chemotaxis protein
MKTALIIEDNSDILENIEEILMLAGFKVITAINGKEGVTTALSKNPDVILCDIMMPEMNGYEVLTALKENGATAGIPFIYVTASAEKSEVLKAMEMGASGYVRKPFDVADLINAIQQILPG